MVIKPGSSYEAKLIGEAVVMFMTGGVTALALAAYESSNTPLKDSTKRDCFFAGLAYSEFFANDSSDVELCAAADYRTYVCTRIGVDGFEVFKATENIYEPGRYK